MNIVVEKVKLSHIDKIINVTIPNGLVYIKGANGAGKTLLLDTIAGLVKNKKGRVYGNENIIYINQSTYFSDKLKTKNLLEFTYYLDGARNNKKEFVAFLKDFLDSSHIGDILEMLEKRWGILSGGERKFIYSVIALSISKDWYIMDEPFAYVDDCRKNILIDIMKARLSEGKNIIITSHETFEAMESLNPYIIEIS